MIQKSCSGNMSVKQFSLNSPQSNSLNCFIHSCKNERERAFHALLEPYKGLFEVHGKEVNYTGFIV